MPLSVFRWSWNRNRTFIPALYLSSIFSPSTHLSSLHTIIGNLFSSCTDLSYSTCLGRVVRWRNQNKLGFLNLDLPERVLELLKDDINGLSFTTLLISVAPNGLLFVKPTIRRAVLAKMLNEILDTRVMVKKSMGLEGMGRSFIKLQNNRQLALKYIANVTYGYVSASFSGRMPCAEIADSIVQTGRETLEKVSTSIALLSRGNRSHSCQQAMGGRGRLW